MDEKFNYFDDFLAILIADKTEQLGDKYIINDERLQVAKKLCEAVDLLDDEINFDNFGVGFDIFSGNMIFKITTACFVVSNKTGGYYALLENAKSFKISTAKIGETMDLTFEFESIWDYIGG